MQPKACIAAALTGLSSAWALACGPDGGAADAGSASLYPEVQAIVDRSCAFERCHRGAIIGAGLYLDPDGDLRATLVGRPACEYERMALVEPGHPERSWIMVKLTAPFRPQLDPYANYIEFEPDSDWDQNQRGCPDATDDGRPLFGQRMPNLAPNQLTDDELETLADWIAQGAPP